MLLLTANESKHLSEGMAFDKKPAGHGFHLLFASAPLFFLSSRFVSHCGNSRATIIANFRFGDATCQLPFRVALSPRVCDVYLAGSLCDLSHMRIPPSGRFIELYRYIAGPYRCS